jgi:hypothetical protein
VQSWEVHGTTARRNQEYRQGEEEMGLLLHVLDISRGMRSIIITTVIICCDGKHGRAAAEDGSVVIAPLFLFLFSETRSVRVKKTPGVGFVMDNIISVSW